MAARRVAFEMGQRVGETAGYQVRFEEMSSGATRVLFITEGVLPRRLLTDALLQHVGAVILDEFHERHLETDLALALVRHLQQTTRKDLKLIVMSATLESARLSDYLDGCPVVRSEGRLFDVDVTYAGYSAQPLEEQVAAAVARTMQPPGPGNVLVFLPGAAEIRKAARACEPAARQADALLLPLHGDLRPEEQDRALEPAKQRKIILSTNVAESSVTIDGVATVIDSGFARIASDSPWTGLSTLQVQRVSQASAVQRAGRAGRTASGRAIRLYSIEDFHRRPAYDLPEIRRRELSSLMLTIKALGLRELPWYEAPPQDSMQAAEVLLSRLTGGQDVRKLARYPLHPRLAKLVLESDRRGAGETGCRLAAIMSSGERYEEIDMLDAVHQTPSMRIQQIERQLRRLGRRRHQSGTADEGLRLAAMTAFADRVARRRSGRDVQLCTGGPALLASDWNPEFLVVLDIEDRREAAAPLVRLAAEIQPEWLLDLFPERVREVNEVIWNPASERAEAVSALMYEELVIEETRHGTPDPQRASALLAEKAIENRLDRFVDPEEVESFLARVAFAAEHSSIRPLAQDDIAAALQDLSMGLRSFAELKRAAQDGGFIRALRNRLGPEMERALNETAPERIPLKGRQVKVQYARNQSPWIASRLQDFFGMKETPRIARGKVPVLVHLLAPNHRPVQVTADLAGFWQRLYPQVRRELSRRYPKHAWPESPF
jgi:ATP-dependent helicase HrpB